MSDPEHDRYLDLARKVVVEAPSSQGAGWANALLAEHAARIAADARVAELAQALRRVLDAATITWPLAFDEALDAAAVTLKDPGAGGYNESKGWR